MEVEFGLLGGVRATVGGHDVPLGSARQRCVLGALLADANQVVTTDQLIDRVWGATPPASVMITLRTYLSRLRTLLPEDNGVGIHRRQRGYLLSVAETAIDLHRFRRLVTLARSSDDERAADLFTQAFDLWRGEPFAGLDTDWLTVTREAMRAEHLAALLDFHDVQLRRNRHGDLITTLARLAHEHPLDERLAGQLVLALYRAGRQADALTHYERTRRRLADELGADPTPALRQLHQRILTAEVAEVAPVHDRRPRQLPAAPRSFVGRGDEQAMLSKMAATGTTVISAIGGAGGIGKTWLALHWAHDHLDLFPDGQLYVNLRGFDATEEPVPVAVAVRGFLDALGVPAAEIPTDLDGRTALYRSLVARRRMLVVLDNAADTAQASALLPGGRDSTVLVTSRRRLTGLVATHGARSINLDVLPDHEAWDLLARHLGHDRLAAEPEVVAELLAWCAGLPLALGLVAARVATTPALALAGIAAELRDEAARLDALDTGEDDLSLRAVFSWSRRALTPAAAALFPLLGLAPGPDISAATAAVLAPDARRLLLELESANLLSQVVTGRYRMHDLVRLYAVELASSLPDTAMRGLVEHYLHTAHHADQLIEPHRPPVDIGAGHAITLRDKTHALAWFDAELPCLLAAQAHADARGWTDLVWQLAWSMHSYLRLRAHLRDNLAAWSRALDSVRHSDLATRAIVLRFTGDAYARTGDYERALQLLGQNLDVARELGDIHEEAHTNTTMAWSCERLGDDRRALGHTQESLRLQEKLDQPVSLAHAFNAVGWFHIKLGELTAAREHCERALEIFRAHGNTGGEADTLDSLGLLAYRAHDHDLAVQRYEEALTAYRDVGNTSGEADTLDRIGQAELDRGHVDAAHRAWTRALEMFRLQDRQVEAAAIATKLAALDG